jgi:tetratricopeptide (TPR) repeat protein
MTENDKKEERGLDSILAFERQAYSLEKEGKLDEAKRLYWQIINTGFAGSFPYERLRMICAKQKDWKEAIKACRAYIDVDQSYPGYDIKSRRMKKWMREYEAKLGVVEWTHASAEEILAQALHRASDSARTRLQALLPAFRPVKVFPKWARGEVAFESVKVTEFQQYYPTPGTMNIDQRKFYRYWMKQWKKGKHVDVKGNISYLFAYTYEVIYCAETSPQDALSELRLLQHVYRNEQRFAEYLTHWIFELYLLNSDYLNAIAYVASQRGLNKGMRADPRVLSLKYKIGLPISGDDIFGLWRHRWRSSEPRKIVLENLDIVIDYLEETIRDYEQKNNVDLLSLITEQFAHHSRSEFHLFAGVPNYHPKIQFDLYEYSMLGDFDIVTDQWMKNAENALRATKGLPKIGEKWFSETILYNIVAKIFSELGYEVVHHSYPPFLRRQELDIHIPALNLGIEYNGLQHYEPIEFFGGQEGFEKRQALDEKNKRLCKENGVTLVSFKYDEPLEENLVRSKLYNAISKIPAEQSLAPAILGDQNHLLNRASE